MAQQGQYPIGNRQLGPNDTVTGVVTGQTADIPLSLLSTFIVGQASTSGPTANRPIPTTVSQAYFDTDLGYMIWCKQFNPTVIWVNAAGVPV